MENLITCEPFKVMIHNPNEYELALSYPTDNVLVHDFHHTHTLEMSWFLDQLKSMAHDDQTLIVLFGLYQDLTETISWIPQLNDFYNCVPNPMVVFNGRLTTTVPGLIATLDVPYHKLLMFDRVSTLNWHNMLENRNIMHMIDHAPVDRAYKAYWASSKDYYPRRYLLSHLIQDNVISDCLVNYKCIQTEFIIRDDHEMHGPGFPDRFMPKPDWHKYDQINQECEKIAHLVPLPALDDTIEFNQTDPAMFWNSYVGIVTDTVYDDPDVYLSEKLFNTMLYNQIFCYLGPPRTLQYLKRLGYQTFDDIIDESFDQIDNHADRLFAATASIMDFLRQPLPQIKQAYLKVLPKIQHNKNWLLQQRPDHKYTELCQQAIDKK